MGRTVTPFSTVLSQEQSRLARFRRALRAEDRLRFDQLFEHARQNIQAGVQSAAPDPMESLLLLMLIGMQREIDELRARLDGPPPPFALVASDYETAD